MLAIAEIGDKTQIAIVALSLKVKSKQFLFMSALMGLMIADILAILFGELVQQFVPISLFLTLSGLVFLYFAMQTYFENENEKELKLSYSYLAIASLIFMAELGDKSQISVALFTSLYSPLTLILITLVAMATLVGLSIGAGKLLSKIDPTYKRTVISALFLISGAICTIQGLDHLIS